MGLKDDLVLLTVGKNRGNGGLPDPPERDAISEARGDADFPATGSGTKIKSLSEVEGVRTLYQDEITLTSSDGVFVFVGVPIKSTVFVTQDGDQIPTTYQP